MSQNLISNFRDDRAVARWIFIGIIMLVVQVLLGGITRLTGSGLSITEWNVVTGTLPPLNNTDWMEEFNKYMRTPQYRFLNADFTLNDFKFIFFWEWFHRFWARLIGVVFLVGFVYLVSKRKLKANMQRPLLILFLMGALQGAVGWIMVMSGLTGDEVYVKPVRLALHFIFAVILVEYAIWFWLQLTVKDTERMQASKLKSWVNALIVVLIPQLMYGALMAGHKGATAAPTWPTINGDWIPASLFSHAPWLINFIDNKITVHFVHRGLAYLFLVLVIIFTVKAVKTVNKTATFNKWFIFPLVLTCLQVLLGVLSVLVSPDIIPNVWGGFEWFAQLHQLVGLLLISSLVTLRFLVQKNIPK